MKGFFKMKNTILNNEMEKQVDLIRGENTPIELIKLVNSLNFGNVPEHIFVEVCNLPDAQFHRVMELIGETISDLVMELFE